MKRYTVLTAMLSMAILVFWVPAYAFAPPDPKFGVEVELNHVDKHDDRMDIMICNYTTSPLVHEGATEYDNYGSGYVDISYWTQNGYPDNGYKAPSLPGGSSSLTSIKWLHTDQDNPAPFLDHNYMIGQYWLRLMVYPQKNISILTDLEFAWHVMEAVGNIVEMAYGDEEAEDQFYKNVKKAVKEGNQIADESNQAWAGISQYEDMGHDPQNLTYPIIYQMVGGNYVFNTSSQDHLAFALGQDYVVQLVTVNSLSDLTGNPQLIVNVYTRDQWNQQQNPWGHIGWWPETEHYNAGCNPSVSMADDGTVINVNEVPDSDNLFYVYGKMDANTQYLGWYTVVDPYDTGKDPSVALSYDDSSGAVTVVEVHKSENDNTLWWYLGTIPSGSKLITKLDHASYTTGCEPSVAMSGDGTVVEVHKSENADTLWYSIGKIDGQTLSGLGKVTQEYDTGIRPAVALMDDKTVIEVHQSENYNTLYYRLGTIAPDGVTINWWMTDSIEYDASGQNPSVAVYGDGTLVESDDDGTYLYYRIGKVDKTNMVIDWAEKDSDENGVNAAVALNSKGWLVQLHKSENDNDLYSRAGWILE